MKKLIVFSFAIIIISLTGCTNTESKSEAHDQANQKLVFDFIAEDSTVSGAAMITLEK